MEGVDGGGRWSQLISTGYLSNGELSQPGEEDE